MPPGATWPLVTTLAPSHGKKIVFDTARRPLPEIPQPNDIATFADPTSRTGWRINVSLVSPTRLESVARKGFNSLEGWGTFAPVTVAFASPLDLTTGVPVILDMGKGNFPLSLVDRTKYRANDPRANEDTIMFETVQEGFGLPKGAHRADLDTDFDGVLDHPDVLRPTGRKARIEDVIPWYERESDTLILRPVVLFFGVPPARVDLLRVIPGGRALSDARGPRPPRRAPPARARAGDRRSRRAPPAGAAGRCAGVRSTGATAAARAVRRATPTR